MAEAPLAFLDLEMTGLDPESDRVVEVCIDRVVGGNRVAAQARGISLRRTRFGVFIASGVCGGMAGLLFAAANAAFGPTAGADFLLPVIAAVILAGVSLSGGRGNLLLLLLSVTSLWVSCLKPKATHTL